MQSHNASLTKDIAKLKALRDAIQAENEKPTGADGTVNQAKIATLQAEIQALEAKHQGEGLQMANQRAIMFMVGQDDAQRVYLETRDRGWIDSNSKQIKALGQAITK
jgi:septal ring factor EnvC (AmiA/AmiB activator)